MIYLLLILFFGSLFGITFMIGKKLLMLQSGQALNVNADRTFFEAPHLEEWKQATIKNTKKHGYSLLVTIIRFYFRSLNFLKNKSEEFKMKIKNAYRKNMHTGRSEKREVSKFLKVVSEYKNKVRRIKEQVKEEENL